MSLVCLSSANCFWACLCIFRRCFLLGRQPCRPILMPCVAYDLSTDRLTPHPFNLCSNAGSTHTSISQTQPLDMMLSMCTQLLWSTMARPVLSGTCPVAQWSKVLWSDESKFCISFGNQGPRVWRKGGEAHSPNCLKSSVKFPQSVMIWGAMSSAGVGPLCFLKTNVTAPVYQEILEHFMLPSADQLFKDADFIFPAGFVTCPHCQKHQKLVKWPWCWCAWLASKLTRPEPHREYMRCCQEENADELKATVKETWASTPPQQCHKLITSMPRRIEAVIKAKGASTKYWVHIQ